jgi:tryptophan synthase beta chain
MSKVRVNLDEHEIPNKFLNLNYYLKTYLGELPSPPLHPATKAPIGPEDLAPIFPMGLIKQEVSLDEFIEIPDEVLNIYKSFRPTPLIRALRLEKELDTPAKIYFKYEGVSPSGSHKLNTALVQAYYNKQEGIKNLSTETGAGQWGSALAIACQMFKMGCTVFMVRSSALQKPYRKYLMEVFGAEVIPSPSLKTNAGRKILSGNPDHPGTLGAAISEAVEIAATNSDTNYSLGSVLNHVLLHQTIIGLEAKKQMEKLDNYPDVVIGCHGGGSNLAGISFPFIADKLKGTVKNLRVIAVEPESCPSLVKGKYEYDFGDTMGLTPLVKMYTLGHDFIPSAIHAGGLRYHGSAPLVSFLKHKNLIEAVAIPQLPTFEAGIMFARAEGIVPAPESCHAIRVAIDEALKAKAAGQAKIILFNLSGHGHFDMQAYGDYLAGKLQDNQICEPVAG